MKKQDLIFSAGKQLKFDFSAIHMCPVQNENDSAFPQLRVEKKRDEPIVRSEKKRAPFEAQDFSLNKNGNQSSAKAASKL